MNIQLKDFNENGVCVFEETISGVRFRFIAKLIEVFDRFFSFEIVDTLRL